MNTALVPNAWNPKQRVKHITAMIKSNGGHGGSATSKTKLTWLERVMEAPLAAKAFQLRSLGDTNSRAYGKFS